MHIVLIPDDVMNLKERFSEYKRVLQIARKPGKDEFTSTAKISLSGMGVIGIIGFVIFLVFILTGI